MRKLSSPGKMWKIFITSLQTQLHKLNRSKAIVKRPIKTRKRLPWPTFSFKSRPKRHRFLFKVPQKLRRLRKGPSPVYIDQLFLESNHVETFKEDIAAAAGRTKKSNVDMMTGTSNRHETSNESTSTSADDMSGQRNHHHGSGIESTHTADDMWESLLLSSPQMYGINERADEFIARFRAEMQLQEMLSNQ